MNRHIARVKDVAAAYAPLVAASLIGSGTLSAPPTNTALVYVEGDDGGDFPLAPGQWEKVVSVDLSTLRVKGTPGDQVLFFGGTW